MEEFAKAPPEVQEPYSVETLSALKVHLQFCQQSIALHEEAPDNIQTTKNMAVALHQLTELTKYYSEHGQGKDWHSQINTKLESERTDEQQIKTNVSGQEEEEDQPNLNPLCTQKQLIATFQDQISEVDLNKFISHIYDYQRGIIRSLNELEAIYAKWKMEFLDSELQSAGGLHFLTEKLSLNQHLLTQRQAKLLLTHFIIKVHVIQEGQNEINRVLNNALKQYKDSKDNLNLFTKKLFDFQTKLPPLHQDFIQENVNPKVLKAHLKEVLKQNEEEDSGLISAMLSVKKGGVDPVTIQRIKSIAEHLQTNETIENEHYKCTKLFTYDGHKSQKILMDKKYTYLHGRGNTVDILDPYHLTKITTLELDNKRMIVALEVDQWVFFGCEGGTVFSFNLEDYSRIRKSSTQQPVTARFWIEENFIIAGESSGYMQVIKMPELEIIHTKQLRKQGVVSQIERSKRGIEDGMNELIVSTYKGITFVTYSSEYSLTESEELYFDGKTVTSFIEYQRDKIVAAVCNVSEYIQVIDRNNRDFKMQVTHPAGITSVLQLWPIYGFDDENLCYCFVRDKQNLSFYDIKNNQAYWTLKSKQCDTTLYQMAHQYDNESKALCVDIIIWADGNTKLQRYEFGI